MLFQHTLWTDVADRPLATDLVSPYAGVAIGKAIELRKKLQAAIETIADLESKKDPNTGWQDEHYGQLGKVRGAIRRMTKEIETTEATALGNGSDTTDLMAVKRDAQVALAALDKHLDLD